MWIWSLLTVGLTEEARDASGTAGAAYFVTSLRIAAGRQLTERLVAAQRHNTNEEKVRDHLKTALKRGDNNLFKLGAGEYLLGRKAANKEGGRFATVNNW